MKRLIIFFIILLATSYWLLATVSAVHAQLTVQSITITNPSIAVTVNPGDKKEGTVSLINDSDGDVTFLTGVYDFIVADTNGTPQILPYGTIAKNKYSAANWVAIYPAGFTVKAGQRYTLNYYIQIPADAAPGGHYAAIVYQPVPAGATKGSGASINSQIASLVYITVNGKVKESAQVTQFSAKPFQEFGPVTIKTEIQNLGDLHIRPEGTITVKNIFGKTVTSVDLDKRNIFPGGVAVDYLNSVGQMWMFGRYSAELIGNYGSNGNLPLFATTYFWVIPWRVTLVVILVIVAIILGYFYWKRSKEKEKKMDEMTQTPPTQTSPDNPTTPAS